MKVLIVGSGGREHALAWQSAQSAQVEKVFVAPGNAGTALEPGVENVPIPVADLDGLVNFAREQGVDLTIAGPEDPLVNGIVNRFAAAGLACFGPSATAAQLEGSKSFAKDFMARHGIPTAAYGKFTEVTPAIEFIRDHGAPIVVKADGLAAGKGVIVADNVAKAEAAVVDMLAGNAFGEAGHSVVIEEFLEGEEASFFVLSDGKNALPLATAQDHKRAFDGDEGPNTGGMGAYSPAPVMTPVVTEAAMALIVRPTLAEMVRRGTPFRGMLYAGLMIEAGEPRLVEYNVRFGDPEAQVLAMRLGAQLLDACHAAAEGRLAEARITFADDHALCVVMAARGYPGEHARGEAIGLPGIDDPRVRIFHAGTRREGATLVSKGGRVLNVTARGESLAAARDLAYATLARIDWPGGFARSDIGWRALAR